MVDKNESENAAAPSNDPASGAKARAVAFTFGRRAWAQLGLLVALAVVTVVALLQEPKPNPFEPVPSAALERAWQMIR